MDVVTGRTHVVVLGGGLVGGFIARHGARDPNWHITLVDRDRETLDSLQRKVLLSTNQADLTDRDVVRKCIEEADLVINALPGHIAFQALTWVIEAGVPVVDISFYPEDPLRLHEMAETLGVTAVVDCGVMPGLGGMIAANFCTKLDTPEALKIMVGGIPQDRVSAGPFEYKAPFSPLDVIEEYTRPARMKVNGEVVTVHAMSDLERVDMPNVGELEAFNTDGLRTLLATFEIPNMVEKTLRWPGHAEKIEFLRNLGFFEEVPVRIKGATVRPRDATAAVLLNSWQIGPDDKELTVMTVEVEGVKDGRRIRHRCQLLDRTQEDGSLSMARTTGYPALLAAKALLGGRLPGPGIIPAEQLGFNQTTYLEFLNGFMRYELALIMSQRDMGAADEPVTEPLVMPPTRVWQPADAEAPIDEAPAAPRARAVAAVAPVAETAALVGESMAVSPSIQEAVAVATPEEMLVAAEPVAEEVPAPASEVTPVAAEPPADEAVAATEPAVGTSTTEPAPAEGPAESLTQEAAAQDQGEIPAETAAVSSIESIEETAPAVESDAIGPAPDITVGPEDEHEDWLAAVVDPDTAPEPVEPSVPVEAVTEVVESEQPLTAAAPTAEQVAEAAPAVETAPAVEAAVEIPAAAETTSELVAARAAEAAGAEDSADSTSGPVEPAPLEPAKIAASLTAMFGPAPTPAPEPPSAQEVDPPIAAEESKPDDAPPALSLDDEQWRNSRVATVRAGAFTPEALEAASLEEIVDNSALAARLATFLDAATTGLPTPSRPAEPEPAEEPTITVVEVPGFAPGGLAEAVTAQAEPSTNGAAPPSVNGFGGRPAPADDEEDFRPLNGEA